ncbi:S-methyl-5-thioribose-1-phosphate isomerase [Coemansia sp. RSA 552]|nr:S-methyl-5-thioribose-1-phosphate isomerase [Coemansia sp. RSA 552]
MDSLVAISWERPRLRILDQLLLPHKREWIDIPDSAAAHQAIRLMQTRGAPAIAIVAALSLAAELEPCQFRSVEEAQSFIAGQLDMLLTARPTAVNLSEAVGRLKAVCLGSKGFASGRSVAVAYIEAAEAMLARDVEDNRAIGTHGAEYLQGQGVRALLTHCNTGALATAGHGTALGIVRSLKERGGLDHVYFTETRPYNQGARLTAFELGAEKIPATLVCDSAVSALLRKLGDASVAVVVGADRIARNGDTANKIGTYQLAVAAKFHNCPFVVAAPSTSIDLGLADGSGIVIEERDPNEILQAAGFTRDSVASGTLKRECLQVAPLDTHAWNPSFDVTPASLISAIVTERGVFEKKSGRSEFTLE